MKIAFCTDGIFPLAIGGMQRHSRLLIEELAKDKENEIVVFHPHQESLFNSFGNVKEISIPAIDPAKNYLVQSYNYSKAIYSELVQLPDHIIYSQGLSVWYKASDFSNRLIINPHGLEPYQGLTLKDKLLGLPFRLIFDHLFNSAKHVVSLGGKLTSILQKTAAKGKIVVLPNAVNISEESVHVDIRQGERLVFLFLGRFAFNKGIGILIQAIKELNQEGYEEKLLFKLGGTGPLLKHYKEEHQIPNVQYLGFIDDTILPDLYKEASAFVFPTLFEGMPTVVLEAMSYGKPIIVSDVGATAELVDKHNGFLINPGSVAELKKAILSFVRLNIEERNLLGAYSFKKVKENFTWPVVAKRHKELFSSLQL